MIFYTCQVYNSSDVLVASWGTAQAADFDGVIAEMSEIRVGLGDGFATPMSSVELRILRSAATDALLATPASAFSLKYKIGVSIDGALSPLGTFFHSAELPVADAQTHTLFLQDAVSRLGSTAVTPTLEDIVLAGDFDSNPLFGAVADFAFVRGTETDPVRIAFGQEQISLGDPIWRKVPKLWGPGLGPTEAIFLSDWMHFVSHATIATLSSTPVRLFAFDGGSQLPERVHTIAGVGSSYVVSSVPVTKNGVTWYVQIVSVRVLGLALWIFDARRLGHDREAGEPPWPLLSTEFQAPTTASIASRYTATEAEIWGRIPEIIGTLPLSMEWELASEVGASDGATVVFSLLLLCDSRAAIDMPSFLRTQAVARTVAGVARGDVREILLQVCTAAGIAICASRDGLIQFVAPTSATRATLTVYDDVRFSWRETGGRDAAFCGVQLVNVKTTPTTIAPDGGTVMLPASAMFQAGIRDAVLQVDCTLIPRAMQGDAASVLSFIQAETDGRRLVSLRVPVRDAVGLIVGDNIQFNFVPYIGATPELVTVSIESMVFLQDNSVELRGVFFDFDYAPYILPGERLQSIVPALQVALGGSTRDPEFQDGDYFFEYTGTHWRSSPPVVSLDGSGFDIWIRYIDAFGDVIHAKGVGGYDVTDGFIISRAAGDLEAATTTLRGLDRYDLLAVQSQPTFLGSTNLVASTAFAAINDAVICAAIGLDAAMLPGLVWEFDGADVLRTPSALAASFSDSGWCAVVDGVAFEVGSVIAGGIFSPGYISIVFTGEPTWRVGTGGLLGLHFARVAPTGLDTGALTEADGTGTPDGPRVLG